MRIIALPILGLCCLLGGCGKTLSGHYEGRMNMPSVQIPGADPKMQKALNDQMGGLKGMSLPTMDFKGSTVRMGAMGVINEYRYTIEDNRLEVIAQGMGQKSILPMTIEQDGSITWMTMNFRKTR